MNDDRIIEFEVGGSDHDNRIDRVIADSVDELSRNAAARLIGESRVSVNGLIVVKVSHRVENGQTVAVEIPASEKTAIEPQDLNIEIVYEDEHLAVIDKPAGMVVHPSAGHPDGTLVNALMFHFGSLSVIGGEERPGIVHRLDKGTSGLIVVAKSDAAHRFLQENWHTEQVQKTYQAIVYGSLEDGDVLVDAPIGRHRSDRKRMAVVEGGREARTVFRLVEKYREASVVECDLLTGRTHQIRAHLEHLKHPIVGDPVYGGPMWKGIRDRQLSSILSSLDRPALHSSRLRIEHPITGSQIELRSELPQDLQRVVDYLRSR